MTEQDFKDYLDRPNLDKLTELIHDRVYFYTHNPQYIDEYSSNDVKGMIKTELNSISSLTWFHKVYNKFIASLKENPDKTLNEFAMELLDEKR